MPDANPELIPEQPTTTPLEEWLFAKLPAAPTNYQQLVYEFCTQQKLQLTDALITLIMYATSMKGAASPGLFFLEQMPGEAEQAKLNDFCMTENLTPEAAILSLLNRALEQPQVLDEARKSPFIAQAQQQLGTQQSGPTVGSPFMQRQQKSCETCGNAFKPRNIGQRFCENPDCWAAGAGFVTHAQRTGEVSAPGSQVDQRLTKIENMFAQLMQTMQGQGPQNRQPSHQEFAQMQSPVGSNIRQAPPLAQ